MAPDLKIKKTEKNVRVVGKRKRKIVKIIVPKKSWYSLQSTLSTLFLRGLYFLPIKSLHRATIPLYLDNAWRRGAGIGIESVDVDGEKHEQVPKDGDLDAEGGVMSNITPEG